MIEAPFAAAQTVGRRGAAQAERVAGGVVDPEPGFRALRGAVAPDARAELGGWRMAG